MRDKIFLYKEQNTDDRDCVKYVELERLGKLECGHYFPKIMVTGACFGGGENFGELDFDNITSILTEGDFKQIDDYNKELRELGYGITEGDEKYQKGIELYTAIEPVLNKLLSEENENLFRQVQEEEKEYLMEEHGLDEDDIEQIFDHYYQSYRDRGIISHIFNSIEDASYEEAKSLGYVTKENERWFDYDKFGEDLLEEERYLELSDGRIVVLNY